MKISFISTFREEYLVSENVILYILMCNKMALRETTRSRIYYLKKKLLLLINIIFCGYIPIYFLHNILDNIVILKLKGSLLEYNNY